MALGRKFVIAARLSAAIVLLGAVTVLCADLPARAEAQAPAQAAAANGPSILTMRVVDGDTIENTTSGVRYRLENIDAAPTGEGAGCVSERELGGRAAAAAEQLLGRAHTVALTPTGRFDQAGKPMVFISVDGRDLGELLMAQGAARPARARAEPWCDTGGDAPL